MTELRERCRSLLRWYPSAWRERNEAIVLGMLEDDAEAQGLHRPSRRDAASIRVHGLAERATPRAARRLAAGALVVMAIVQLLVWLRPIGSLGQLDAAALALTVSLTVLQSGVAAPLIGLALLVLLRERLGIVANDLVRAAVAVVGASLLLAAGATIAVLESQASGRPQEWLVASLIAGWSVIAVGLVPAIAHALGRVVAWMRWPLVALTSGLVALLALLFSAGGALGWVAAVVFAASLVVDQHRTVATGARAGGTVAGDRDGSRTVGGDDPGWSPTAVGGLASSTAAVGLALLVTMVVLSAIGDGVDSAMANSQLLAMASFAAVGVVAATALMLQRRLGAAAWRPAAAFTVSAMLVGVAHLSGFGTPLASLAFTAAAAIAGVGVGVLAAVATPGPLMVRTGSAIGVAAVTTIALQEIVVAFGTVAPFAALAVVALAIARARSLEGVEPTWRAPSIPRRCGDSEVSSGRPGTSTTHAPS